MKTLIQLLILTICLSCDYTGSKTETYFEKKMTIEEIEDAEPLRFLDAGGKYNDSFWGTKIHVNGTISNTATVADYKDITVRVTYYSKTKTNLGSKEYTIYEVVQPNTTIPFKLKIENFKNVNTIGWEVIRAIPIK